MRNDIKTLIATLTTERNSIDRAITALKGMSDAREPEPMDSEKRPKARRFLTDDDKREIIAQMRLNVGHRTGLVARLARQYRVPATTLQTGWKKWDAALNNGHASTTTGPVSYAGQSVTPVGELVPA